MMGLDNIRARMVQFLRKGGINAVTAWGADLRKKVNGVLVTVCLKQYQGGPAGFQDYLGEQLNLESGRWEDLYGKKIQILLGLDLYAPPSMGETAICSTFDRIAELLRAEGPDGLHVLELSTGATSYDHALALCHASAEARCQAFLYAVSDQEGTFLDFEIRGVNE